MYREGGRKTPLRAFLRFTGEAERRARVWVIRRGARDFFFVLGVPLPAFGEFTSFGPPVLVGQTTEKIQKNTKKQRSGTDTLISSHLIS